MNERDTFAAAALTGMLARNQRDYGRSYTELVALAYTLADAMMKERAKPIKKEVKP